MSCASRPHALYWLEYQRISAWCGPSSIVGDSNMAKKSAAARQANASRRLAAAAKEHGVTLVKPAGTPSSATPTPPRPAAPTTKPANSAAPKARPAPARSAPARPATPASAAKTMPPATAPLLAANAPAKPTAAPAPRPPAPMPPARTSRSSRAARVRGGSLVTPEHYAYVRNDLRLTAVLAVIMFAVIIGLYFYLHSIGQA